ALVDVPLFWSITCLMFVFVLLLNHICPLSASGVLTLIACVIGYGASLVLLVYLIAFRFRKGRSNRFIWSFIFVLVNFTLYTFSDSYGKLYFTFCALIPMFPLLGWL
ncbi:ABCA9 protein, partial [Upupa epops]|nr:ABCA9 protein [Upupa epops]